MGLCVLQTQLLSRHLPCLLGSVWALDRERFGSGVDSCTRALDAWMRALADDRTGLLSIMTCHDHVHVHVGILRGSLKDVDPAVPQVTVQGQALRRHRSSSNDGQPFLLKESTVCVFSEEPEELLIVELLISC